MGNAVAFFALLGIRIEDEASVTTAILRPRPASVHLVTTAAIKEKWGCGFIGAAYICTPVRIQVCTLDTHSGHEFDI
jgi:hypothetical protein